MTIPELALDMAIGLAFIAGAMTIALGTYLLTHRVASRFEHEKTKDLAGSITFRVAGLHALIVALIFAQELLSYQELRKGFLQEATAVADIFFDLDRYQVEDADPIRLVVAKYVETVITEDWRALAENRRVSSIGYTHFETIYNYILDLEPESGRQEALRDHMLTSVHALTTYRQARTAAAQDGISLLFWLAAIAGLILVCAPYFVFPPTALHLSLVAIFSIYMGLVLFIIYSLSDPFSPPGAIQPAAFVQLLDGEIGRWLQGPPGN